MRNEAGSLHAVIADLCGTLIYTAGDFAFALKLSLGALALPRARPAAGAVIGGLDALRLD